MTLNDLPYLLLGAALGLASYTHFWKPKMRQTLTDERIEQLIQNAFLANEGESPPLVIAATATALGMMILALPVSKEARLELLEKNLEEIRKMVEEQL